MWFTRQSVVMAAIVAALAAGVVGAPVGHNVSLLDGLYTRTTSYEGRHLPLFASFWLMQLQVAES